MIEVVVALLMFINGEIKEARLQTDGMSQCLKGKRLAERDKGSNIQYMCGKVEAELETNIDGSKAIKKIITNK